MPDTDTETRPPRASQAAARILPADSPQAAGARPAALPVASLSEQRARLGRMIRRGCETSLLDTPLVFSIEPAAPDAEWSGSLFLSPAQGDAIEVAAGARLLQGLTGIDPSLLQPPGTARQHWYAAALAGRLAGTPFAGYTLTAPEACRIGEEQCCMRLTLRSRSHQVTSLARASVPAWIDFLSRGEWTFARSPALPWLATASEATVRIAQHTLPSGALRRLVAGDVIVPDSPLFSPDGKGRMRLGNRHVQVRYAAPNGLEILTVERKLTTDELDIEAHAELDVAPQEDAPEEAPVEETGDADALYAELDAAMTDAPPVEQQDPHSELDSIPVTLSFELGKVSLPLAEVRTLGPGAVVLFTGGSPASVAIVTGGHTLGRGEIVDVAGQLGIRVTQWSAP